MKILNLSEEDLIPVFTITWNTMVSLVGLVLFLPLVEVGLWLFILVWILWALASVFMGIVLVPVIVVFFRESRLSIYDTCEDEEPEVEVEHVHINPNMYGPTDTQKIIEEKYSEGYYLVGIWGDNFFFERNVKI